MTAIGPAYGLVSHPENIHTVLPYIRLDLAPRKRAQGSAGIPKPPPRVGSRNLACGTPERYRLVGTQTHCPSLRGDRLPVTQAGAAAQIFSTYTHKLIYFLPYMGTLYISSYYKWKVSWETVSMHRDTRENSVDQGTQASA